MSTLHKTLAVGVLALMGACAGRCQGLEGAEPQVKAAFVLNFAKFVDWPDSAFGPAGAPLIVCSTAREALAAALGALEGRVVHGHEVRVRRSTRGDDLKSCHVLVATDSEDRRASDWIKLVAGLPVLTVGDGEGFAEAGGMIGLSPTGSRMAFDVNAAAAQRVGLRFSSQLLRLARTVR